MNHINFIEEGWSAVASGYLPPRDLIVEFAREEEVFKQLPWFGKWSDLPPEFNVAGLWWRYP